MKVGVMSPRIFETIVPAKYPDSGLVNAIIYGEAPGPRGADKSCHPWWGDEAGKLVFRGLHKAGCFTRVTVAACDGGLFEAARETVPIHGFESSTILFPWSGKRFAKEGVLPVLEGVALSNAWAICPTGDGAKFHRPTNTQMASSDNVERVRREIRDAASRAPRGRLRVIALGTAAGWLLEEHLGIQSQPGVTVARLPHPSPQGILSWRKKLGNSLTVPEVRELWLTAFRDALGPHVPG